MQLSAHHGILKFVKIGTLYVFHFASSPSETNNQTFPVDTYAYDSSTPGMITGSKGNFKLIIEILIQNLVVGVSTSPGGDDPNFGPWNTVHCRNNKALTLQIGGQNANGIVIAVDIYYTGPMSSDQTIFAIRNRVIPKNVFTVEISPSSAVTVWSYKASWTMWYGSTTLAAGKNLLKNI